MKLKIMSFNILCAGQEQNSWINRRESVLNCILKYMPDSLGVQEATPEWMKYLSENLPAYFHAGKARDGENTGECSTVFYLKDKFEIFSDETFWLSETPNEVSFGWDAACRRVCTIVGLKDKSTGKKYIHANTHLDHVGREAMTNGGKMVKSKLESFDLPVICTGDFNINENDIVYQNMTTGKIADSKYIAKSTMNIATFHNFGNIDVTKNTPIDYCFVDKNSIRVLSYKVIEDKREDGGFISDHYPVLVELKIF